MFLFIHGVPNSAKHAFRALINGDVPEFKITFSGILQSDKLLVALNEPWWDYL